MGNRASKKRQLRDGQGAWGMTPQQEDDFYSRWREWMVVAAVRGAVVVANPDHTGRFKDLSERLLEDPWWTLRGIHHAPMMFKEEVPYDALLFWVEGKGLQTPAEFIGRTGFGRMKAAAPTRDGVRSWDTVEVPEGEQKELTTDEATD